MTEKALCAQIELLPALVVQIASENAAPLAIELSAPIHLKCRGADLKLILQGAGSDPCLLNPNLINAILDARRWFAAFTRPESPMSISEIAAATAASPGDISRSMQPDFLAQDLIESALDGRQPPELTAKQLQRLDRLPFLWDDQRRLFV